MPAVADDEILSALNQAQKEPSDADILAALDNVSRFQNRYVPRVKPEVPSVEEFEQGQNPFVSNEFARGVARGTARAAGSFVDFARVFSDSPKLKAIADDLNATAEQIPTKAGAVKDVLSDPSLAPAYVGRVVGELAPQAVLSYLTGGAGSAAGKAAGLGKVGARIATGAGAAASSVPQEVGGIYRETEDLTGTGNSGAALAYGIPAGMLDALSAENIIGKVFRAGGKEAQKRAWRGVVRDAFKALPKAAGIEATTEATQETLALLADKQADETFELLTPQNGWRVLEAAVAGGIGGGLLGGGLEIATLPIQQQARGDEAIRLRALRRTRDEPRGRRLGQERVPEGTPDSPISTPRIPASDVVPDDIQLRRIQTLEQRIIDELGRRGDEHPNDSLLALTEGKTLTPDQYESGLIKLHERLVSAVPTKVISGAAESGGTVADRAFQPTAAPVPILNPIRENGARTSIVLQDGTAIVGGRFHGETLQEAIKQGLATEEQLVNGKAGFTQPDGTTWDLRGKPIPTTSVKNLSEASAGEKALPVRKPETVGRNERTSPPSETSEKGARETGTQAVVTAPESQRLAETMTPEQINAELAVITEQIATRPKAKTIQELDAQSVLNNRANFLREALTIQGAKASVPSQVAAPTRDWDLLYEDLSGELDSFSPARDTGKRNYVMEDVAQRFIDFAKQQPDVPLLESVRQFSKIDEASTSQIKTLKQALGNLNATQLPQNQESVPIQRAGTDAQRTTAEAGARDSLQRAAPQEAAAGTQAAPDAQLNVGDPLRVMGVDSVLAESATIDGIRYELFNGAKLKENRAAVRVTDLDTGNVTTLKQYPTFDAAEREFSTATKPSWQSAPTPLTPAEQAEAQQMLAEAQDVGPAEASAKAIADKLREQFKTPTGRSELGSFGVIPKVLNAAIELAAQIIEKGGRTADVIARAIQAAVDYIKANQSEPFDEPGVRAQIEAAVQQNPAQAPSRQAPVETQVLSDTWTVLGKETTITPRDIEQSSARAKEMLDAAGIPATLTTMVDPRQGGRSKSLWLWTDTGTDMSLAGRKLSDALRKAIQEARQQGADERDLAAILNSVVRNFDRPDSAMARMSESVRNDLFSIAQSERSMRGRLLGMLANFRDDLRSVSLNLGVYLNRLQSDAFGGDIIRPFLEAVTQQFRTYFTVDEIAPIVAANPDLSAIPGITELIRRAVEMRFHNIDDIAANLADILMRERGMDATAAAALSRRIIGLLRAKMLDIAARSLAEARKNPEITKPSWKGSVWKKIQTAIDKGDFDPSHVIAGIAKERKWLVPSAEQTERLKQWGLEEQRLRQLTPSELAAAGEDEVAVRRARVVREESTRPRREELLKRMEAEIKRFALPTSLFRFWQAPYRQNNARFLKEFASANLLFNAGFVIKNTIDVVTQSMIHPLSRGIGRAWQMYEADRVAGRPATPLSYLSSELLESYRATLASFQKGLIEARATALGRTRGRNIDHLLSGIASQERLQRAAERYREQAQAEWAGGNYPFAIANYARSLITSLVGLTRLSYRFAQSLDALAGTLAEQNEIRGQTVQALVDAGWNVTAAKAQAESVLEFTRLEIALATAQAKNAMEASGLEIRTGELKEAAFRILRLMQYEKLRMLGLAADDLQGANEFLRDTVGWNQPERRGVGGAITTGLNAMSTALEEGGIPAPWFNFANAIGISINRKIHHTPFAARLGGGLDGKESAWFRDELDRKQRYVEAIAGTIVGPVLMALVGAGIIRVILRPPRDKEEREAWEAQGHRAGTIEFVTGENSFVPVSLSVGPFNFVSPYLAAAGAYMTAAGDRDKKQARLNEQAAKRGLTPEQLPPLGIGDMLAVGGEAAWQALTGSRSAGGLIGSFTDSAGLPNINRAAAGYISPYVPFLPATQQLSRMAGVSMDSKLASVWDYLLPLPASDARRVNMLGDPAGTPDDVQRIIQTLTGGTTGPVDASADKAVNAYRTIFASGYRPPSIDPNKGYEVGRDFRPFTSTELSRYTQLRGQYFKQELERAGYTDDPDQAKAAYQRANARALTEVGVTVREPVATRQSVAPARRTTGFRTSFGRTRRLGYRRSRIRTRRLGLRTRRRRLGRRTVRL